MNVKLLPFLVLAIALAGCGSGGSAEGGDAAGKADASGGPVTLVLKPKVGAKYKVEEVSESKGKVATMFIDREVKSVDDKGVKIESTVSDVQGDGVLVIGLKMQTELSPRYEVRSNTTQSSNPEFKVVSQNVYITMSMAPVLPAGPVKVGDTWQTSFSLPSMFEMNPEVKIVGQEKIPMDCTYIGTKEVGGMKVAAITLKCDAKSAYSFKDQKQDLSLKLDGEFHYDLETGMLVNSVLTKSTKSDADENTLVTTTKVVPVK